VVYKYEIFEVDELSLLAGLLVNLFVNRTFLMVGDSWSSGHLNGFQKIEFT
jgi:hypothetical protein